MAARIVLAAVVNDAAYMGRDNAASSMSFSFEPSPSGRVEPALVLGAGGRLGSAVLGEALVAGRFASVRAWAAAPLASTVRGLGVLTEAEFASPCPLGAKVAFIVFERERERERFGNRRDEAFVMPSPTELPAIAKRLREGGIERLIVLLPHASSMLPEALAGGFASHDEAAVAALGFTPFVLMKPSQQAVGAPQASGLARFAQWWLSQLRWMVPEREQPLRAAVLARLAVQLARRLSALPVSAAATSTYVVPQALMWQLARDADEGEARLDAWLAARAAGSLG
jgi:predicted transcriptional regulator